MLNGRWIRIDITDTARHTAILAILPDLNFGLESFCREGISTRSLGWCTANVSGTTSQMCNRELQRARRLSGISR